MAAGDLIYVKSEWKGIPFRHFGIDLGDGRVMHLASDRHESQAGPTDLQSMKVRRTSLEAFSGGREIEVVSVSNPLPIEETIRRALSREGEAFYHLTEENCEHFARWCKSGDEVSFQVDGFASQVHCVVRTSAKAIGVLAKKSAGSSAIAATFAPRFALAKWIPAALASDIVDYSVSMAAQRVGYHNRQAKRLGLAAGCATAGIAGLIASGPLGCTALIGVHLASSQLADRVVDQASKWIGDRFQRNE